ncbi:hypothetical protein Tco_0784309 [Tanacetum coccineum]
MLRAYVLGFGGSWVFHLLSLVEFCNNNILSFLCGDVLRLRHFIVETVMCQFMWDCEVGEGQLIANCVSAREDFGEDLANLRIRPLKCAWDLSSSKGVVRFGNEGRKLAPRFISEGGPFEIIRKSQALWPIVPLDEIRVDAKLNFVERAVEIFRGKE